MSKTIILMSLLLTVCSKIFAQEFVYADYSMNYVDSSSYSYDAYNASSSYGAYDASSPNVINDAAAYDVSNNYVTLDAGAGYASYDVTSYDAGFYFFQDGVNYYYTSNAGNVAGYDAGIKNIGYDASVSALANDASVSTLANDVNNSAAVGDANYNSSPLFNDSQDITTTDTIGATSNLDWYPADPIVSETPSIPVSYQSEPSSVPENMVYGCTNQFSRNYDYRATVDDGSCDEPIDLTVDRPQCEDADEENMGGPSSTQPGEEFYNKDWFADEAMPKNQAGVEFFHESIKASGVRYKHSEHDDWVWYYDECLNDKILIENFCGYDDDSNVQAYTASFQYLECEHGCYEGACRKYASNDVKDNLSDEELEQFRRAEEERLQKEAEDRESRDILDRLKAIAN